MYKTRISPWGKLLRSRTVLRRNARHSRRPGLEVHQSELPLHSGEDSRRQPGMGRRSRRDRRRRRRWWAGPSTARHSNRQAEEQLDVRKHGKGQFGAKRRGHRGDWRRSGGGLRVPVDGESARVYRTGMHAAGGKSGAGTRTGGTTRGSNRRCGQTGDNCAMHADIVNTRCPQRCASISYARRVRGGSLAGRGHLC